MAHPPCSLHPTPTHANIPKGGNAGHSAALCGRVLGLPVRVIVPTTTKPLMLDKIRAQGAEVEVRNQQSPFCLSSTSPLDAQRRHSKQVHGDNWNAADALARQLVAQDPSAAYIPPYDHPLLWEGHSTLVDELAAEMGERPAAIVASVGGGGLVCGVYEVRKAALGCMDSRTGNSSISPFLAAPPPPPHRASRGTGGGTWR